jgi:hypothetical protein
MITEPQLDKAGLLAEQKLREHIESFERKYLDYRYPEVEDGETENQTVGIGETATQATQPAVSGRQGAQTNTEASTDVFETI